jgi:hypothetical protein
MSGRARAAALAAFLLMVVGLPARSEASLIGAGSNNLTVVETITQQGLEWLYTYNITSADPSNVWHFLLYTSFATTNGTSTFPSVSQYGLSVVGLWPYDPRNVDPFLTHVTNTWYAPFGGPNGLGTGGTARLSFVSSIFDARAKLFAYETAASGFAVSTGRVAALGMTQTHSVPEPSSALLLVGALAWMAALRRRLTQTR